MLLSEEVIKEGTPQVIEIGTAGAIVTPEGEVRPYSRIVNVLATAYSTEGWKNATKSRASPILSMILFRPSFRLDGQGK